MLTWRTLSKTYTPSGDFKTIQWAHITIPNLARAGQTQRQNRPQYQNYTWASVLNPMSWESGSTAMASCDEQTPSSTEQLATWRKILFDRRRMVRWSGSTPSNYIYMFPNTSKLRQDGRAMCWSLYLSPPSLSPSHSSWHSHLPASS